MKKILFLMLLSALGAKSGQSQCLCDSFPTANNFHNSCPIFQAFPDREPEYFSYKF